MLYDKLLQLPLFLGLNRRDLDEIVGKVRFDFQKCYANTHIYHASNINNSIIFLLKGEIEVERRSNSSLILFRETIKSPSVIGADILFGLTHYFSHDYRAKTYIEYLRINKEQITNLLLNYDIFRLNMLNYLSLIGQRRTRQLWEARPNTLRQQFLQYLSHNFYYQAGPKEIKYKQTDLAKELGCTKMRANHMLHELENEGLLNITRCYITIPAFEKIMS